MKMRRMRSADPFLYGLLALAISAPPYVILAGTWDGRALFTLYREPKLAAFQILGWTFLLLLIWLKRPTITREAILATLRQPLLLAMISFVAWSAATRVWALVPENHFYEWNQYLFLLAFLTALYGWGRRDPVVVRVVLYSLAFSIVPLVFVGLVQSRIDIPFLRSIDPGYGVRHASFMGYKNPMALSLLGHFFLLLHVTWDSFRRRRRLLLRLALAGTCLAELGYLVSLQSRSALLSLIASCALLGGVLLFRSRRPGRFRIALAASTLTVLLLWLLLALNPAATARLESLTGYLRDPPSLLESDRGTYFRNTLHMARHNPFGVGLGEWQTHYPVYRKHNRDLAFTAGHQVRRAHGDHVQFLGELGFPGLALWLALLAAALTRPLRHYLKTGRVLSLFLFVQILALVIAMTADYLVETPYNKFQFLLVCGLAMIACRPLEKDGSGDDGPGRSGAASRAGLPAAALLLAAWSALAIANVWYYSQQLARSYHSSMLTTWYLSAIDELNAGQSERAAQTLSRLERRGERFLRLAGHGKTFYRDYLALAHASLLRGRALRAIELTRESLLLHPYHPNAFGLLASALEQDAPPAAAERARQIQDYVMDRASAGFLEQYPAFLRVGEGPFEARGREDAGAREIGDRWRDVLAGRTLVLGGGERRLHFCRDGRYYSRAGESAGPRLDLGWWSIRAAGESALAELQSVAGGGEVLSLEGSGSAPRAGGRAAELSARNEVCE